MSLKNIRKSGGPVSLVVLASLLSTMVPRTALAGDPPEKVDIAAAEAVPAAPSPPAPSVTTAPALDNSPSVKTNPAGVAPMPAQAPFDSELNGVKDPHTHPKSGAPGGNKAPAQTSGEDKSGGTSQAISVPQGAGKIQGMGESFSAQLSTGIATFSVPFSMPAARGAAQPALGLSYSSSSGHGVAGVGWSVGAPFIARQTDRATPSYLDPGPGEAWHPGQDRFSFNNGQELVPICLVTGKACAGAISTPDAVEVMPCWADGWRYFRARVEGGYQRFFWSSDKRTWRVQDKSGVTMELGVPVGPKPADDLGGLDTAPGDPTRIFRWNLVRQFDAQSVAPGECESGPLNQVVYVHQPLDEGTSYLTDVYATSPAAQPTTAPLSAWAHHVHLGYETRSDVTSSFTRGWRSVASKRLSGVDVATFETGSAARTLVRRYHLAYDAAYHVSLLKSVQVEGRCSAPIAESGGVLPPTNCPSLPAMTFDYQHVSAKAQDGSPGVADLVGYEGFDETIHSFGDSSPDHSVDENLTDVFDINADGLPDTVVAMPGLYGGKFGLFLNGGKGPDTFTATTMCVKDASATAPTNVDAGILQFTNPNIVPLDADGDGLVDLVHMPMAKQYSVHSPVVDAACGYAFVGRPITTAGGLSPKIDFTNNGGRTRVVDVNGDGLVDVVFTSGTQIQTFFALGRFPGGDGQFGHGTWTSNATASLSPDPVVACLPWSATPIQFDEAEVKLADMNGDGLVDIVRVRKGDIRYWPGRGNGFWGTGSREDCLKDGFLADRHVAMNLGPEFANPEVNEIRLDDLNGDGLDDLVQVRFDAVDVWLNVDGVGFTPNRHTFGNTPVSPEGKNRLRLTDINGSGTRDLFWGAGYQYQYVDVLGGRRPWMLTNVKNGLGKETTLEYSTSTQQMLAAAASGSAWKKTAPTVAQVVVRVTDRDHLGSIPGRADGVYVTEYTYADPVYDGRQREFRGFSSTTVKKVGDANSPSSATTSQFLLGECKDEDPNDGVDVCALDQRWRDNPREALKGAPYLEETSDASGTSTTNPYLATATHTYSLRTLYTGLDGRVVRDALEVAGDRYLYDVAASGATASLPNVDIVLRNGVTDTSTQVTLRGKTGRAHLRSESTTDPFGSRTSSVDKGCVDGCSSADGTPGADETIMQVTNPMRPAGDLSGWLWRTDESYVVGADGLPRHRARTVFDSAGNASAQTADLSGTLALARSHQPNPSAPAPTPPSPPNASADNPAVPMGSTTRNQFGQPVLQCGPNGRCSALSYAADYSDLLATATSFVGAVDPGTGYGSVSLSTSAVYDRGLGIVLVATDPRLQKTRADYDGFGRLTNLYTPGAVATPDGEPGQVPRTIVSYELADATHPYSIVRARSQDGASPSDGDYLDSLTVVDGMGRTVASISEADQSAGDEGDFIVSGLTDYDAKGAPKRRCIAQFGTGDPESYVKAGLVATGPCATQSYDAFGRAKLRTNVDGAPAILNVYHAISTDAWDAGDLAPGSHHGTYASERRDGHGRLIVTTERAHVAGKMDRREVRVSYLSSGETSTIVRAHPGATDPPVVRWAQYDTLGRMVMNVEPNTSVGPQIPGTPPELVKAWRYAYDDAGELVGTSDARGCGADYYYDSGGRPTAQDYWPCLNSQATYSTPDFENQVGVEVAYHYDTPMDGTPSALGADPAMYYGRLAGISDRGARTTTSYDPRGRVTGAARQIAKPGAPSDFVVSRYASRWYVQHCSYDAADRIVNDETGAASPELTPAGSFVTNHYSRRGIVVRVDGSYGTLIASVKLTADGRPVEVVRGDAASTTTSYAYDPRLRPQVVQTQRSAVQWASSAPFTQQLVLEDLEYTYDEVNNPVGIKDWRNPAEWPVGAKPVSRLAPSGQAGIIYDDLYRVTKVDYHYEGGGDDWVSPFVAEEADPTRTQPSPHVAFSKRMHQQSFSYDWLGNTVSTDDDAHGFLDRSLGVITNDAAKPYQLRSASQSGAKGGNANATYDEAGNMVALDVIRAGTCLPAGANCSQSYRYEWDEIGRLSRARRLDGPVTPGSAPEIELEYAYDVENQRVRKTAVDASGAERHAIYVFDSLELRRATYGDQGGEGFDYTRSAETEAVRLPVGARLVYHVPDTVPGAPPKVTDGLHVFLAVADHLGSTSIVLDQGTGELVEAGTYTAYGSAESDYRPDRWGAFREDFRFTGKEEDIEVGLTYFGQRYLNVYLGRWVSADPLTVHAAGADLNGYAYVQGRLLGATDPTGLDVVRLDYGSITRDGDTTVYDQGRTLEVRAASYADLNGDAIDEVPIQKDGPIGYSVNEYPNEFHAAIDALVGVNPWSVRTGHEGGGTTVPTNHTSRRGPYKNTVPWTEHQEDHVGAESVELAFQNMTTPPRSPAYRQGDWHTHGNAKPFVQERNKGKKKQPEGFSTPYRAVDPFTGKNIIDPETGEFLMAGDVIASNIWAEAARRRGQTSYTSFLATPSGALYIRSHWFRLPASEDQLRQRQEDRRQNKTTARTGLTPDYYILELVFNGVIPN